MRKVTTYDRFERHVKAWHEGYIPFLAVVGKPGLGKSQAYEDVLHHEEYTLFKGRTTALAIYTTVYDNPDRRIVFDDVSSLLTEVANTELMKNLCDSRPQRTVQWNTSTKRLEDRNRQFVTTARVLVVCNHAVLNNPDVNAILDRADAIEFAPSKSEIVAKMRTYADDQEIVNFLAAMPVLTSLRTYELAKSLKRVPDLDWRQEILGECGEEEHIQTLIRIVHDTSKEKWCEAYMATTGRSRRDFYNHLPLAKELAACMGGDNAVSYG